MRMELTRCLFHLIPLDWCVRVCVCVSIISVICLSFDLQGCTAALEKKVVVLKIIAIAMAAILGVAMVCILFPPCNVCMS